jgi:hypothetical protein
VIALTFEIMKFGSIFMSSGVALIGLDALVFPFATPQTFEIFGIKRAVPLTRAIGVCVIILSPLLAYLLLE